MLTWPPASQSVCSFAGAHPAQEEPGPTTVPAARGWDRFPLSPVAACTPQVGLEVEMSSLQRKKALSDSFERENTVTKCIKIFAEPIRFTQ